MRLTLNRVKLIFVGLFALACIGIWIHQVYWVWPRERCEARGGWWDDAERICGQPIYIPDITGRRPGESREEASMRRAAERAAEERRARGEPVAADPPNEAAAQP